MQKSRQRFLVRQRNIQKKISKEDSEACFALVLGDWRACGTVQYLQ